MINVLKDLWQARKAPKIFLEAAVDHVEVGEDYLMLGLDLAWHSTMPEPLQIEEIQVTLYPNGRRKDGIRFYAQGHFARLPHQKVIKKMPGARQFELPSNIAHIEHIRFMTRAILDLAPGTYEAEFQSTVLEGSFVHSANLAFTAKNRYRTSEAWA